MKSSRRVAHPEWLKLNRFRYAMDLYAKGILPGSIEVNMLVVPLLHALRSIYGASDFQVALILLWRAFTKIVDRKWINFQIALHFGEAYRIDLEVQKDMQEHPKP